ncbi:hypothetical protein PR202_gb14336 [Eleusine coracana subsp. coracana]|uniref:Polyphenol oxidase C-terminal domain-containing protein n=1 Tax=Eleusine coracana subsp. coracana TaxID=191504 RepID=A0AAV5ESX7_ELECO|nr:hypothetical protein PR202_gb14336 [Eleusine coracana subsp. coracana]
MYVSCTGEKPVLDVSYIIVSYASIRCRHAEHHDHGTRTRAITQPLPQPHHQAWLEQTTPSTALLRGHRRDVLLGLGGAALLATSSSPRDAALAQPIKAPDLQNCHPPADLPATAPNVDCCGPTYGKPAGADDGNITDLKLPAAKAPLRVRPAAHLADREYVAKYERAVALMKALPADDPRSSGACTARTTRSGSRTSRSRRITSSLHARLYLYFHERILLHNDNDNVDRMWHLWRTRLHNDNNNNTSFIPDAAFLFYDEDARLVRCRVRDAYQDVALPWLNAKPVVVVAKEESTSGSAAASAITTALPARLDGTMSVAVARPETSRTRERKDEAEEVLVVDRFRFVKFDVFVNATSSSAAASLSGGARGAWRSRRTWSTAARFGICDLLDDIGADGDGTIVVSLVPRAAGDTVTVDGIRIEYVK